jgi:hypothetical protein
MVKCGVFFAVRTEFLNIIYTSFGFKGLFKCITHILELNMPVLPRFHSIYELKWNIVNLITTAWRCLHNLCFKLINLIKRAQQVIGPSGITRDADLEGTEAQNNAKDNTNWRTKLKPSYLTTFNQFSDIRHNMENSSLDKAVNWLRRPKAYLRSWYLLS